VYHRFSGARCEQTAQNATKGVSLAKIGHNEKHSHDVMVTYKKQNKKKNRLV